VLLIPTMLPPATPTTERAFEVVDAARIE
jgi:hypothetical protein